jgi:hypothetical protein
MGWRTAPLKVRTKIVPFEEAHARIAPSSWGAHDTELTGLPIPLYQRRRNAPDAVCSELECSLMFAHPALASCCSFQMITFPPYEHDARMWPNFGCAQATCHTGPVCLSGGRMSSRYSAQKRSEACGLPFQCLSSAALRIVINYIEDLTVRSEEHVARRLP